MNLVDVAVAHPVGEGIDAGLPALRIIQREDVRGHTQLVPVRFVDDGAVELRRQLRVRTVPSSTQI